MPVNSWRLIFIVYLFGVCGNSTVTRLVPLANDIGGAFAIRSADFGWLVSIIAVPAFLFATLSAVFVERFGAARTLTCAAIIVALCDLTYYFASSLDQLIALRLLEGCAIVQFYTAGPALLMTATEGSRRTFALALWATYMPVGTAIGLSLSGLFAESDGWRSAFLLHGGLATLAIVAGMALPCTSAVSEQRGIRKAQFRDLWSAYRHPELVMLGLAAFALVGIGIGANLALPQFIARTHSVPLAISSTAVALATLCMVPGSLLAGALVSRLGRRHILFLSIAFIGAVTGILTFASNIPMSGLYAALAIWFASSGAAMALALSAIPDIAGPQRGAVAAAFINQASALAVIVNPPLWLHFAAHGASRDFACLIVLGWSLASAGIWAAVRSGRHCHVRN